MTYHSVVSWNVNSVKARLDRVLAFIDREKPDYLCLQELKCTDDSFPYAPFQELNYHCHVFGQKAYNGVAVISKTPVEILFKNFDDNDDDISARVLTVNCGSFKLINAYVPNGQSLASEKFDYKLRWLKRAEQFFKSQMNPDERIVFLGDFNIAPDDRDVYDPVAWKDHIHCSAPERDALAQLVSFGFVDTLRMFHQQRGIYSWWDYREASFMQNKGLRIDLIYATPAMALLCKEVRIDQMERAGDKPSDHAPVIAKFDLTHL